MVRVVLALAVAPTIGCDEDRAGPGRPDPAQPAPTAISQAARNYLDALLGIMETYSINKESIDWAGFRDEVFAAAGTAQTIPDTYPAIGVALRLLNDHESYYLSWDDTLIGPAPVGGCAASTPSKSSLPDTIAYVRVGPEGDSVNLGIWSRESGLDVKPVVIPCASTHVAIICRRSRYTRWLSARTCRRGRWTC